MANGEHLAEESCKHRAYTMIKQHYLLRCFIYIKIVIELQYKFASLTHVTKITVLIPTLKLNIPIVII